MLNLELPRRREQNLSIQHVGQQASQETLVYDEVRHQAFCLNPTSACIWSLCDGAHTVLEMSRAASLRLNAPVPEDLVHLALDELGRDGLLQEQGMEAGAGRLPALSRRAMVQSLGASAVVLLPVVAMVLAPRAAQAYLGCYDCSSAISTKTKNDARIAARIQAMRDAGSQSDTSKTTTQVDGDQ